MDWTDYEAVLAYVTQEAPMELHLGETKFSLEQLRALKEALPSGGGIHLHHVPVQNMD